MTYLIKHDTMQNESNIKVSFVLFSYNQEQYIKNALDGFFSQNYSNIEYIICDDFSLDSTADIIENYIKNKNNVIYIRNKKNKGLMTNINYIMGFVSGELVVVAAGDDISFEDRVKENVIFYINNNYPDSIFSDYLDMSESGELYKNRIESKPIEQSMCEFIKNPMVKGAAHAWTKKLFENFGQIAEDVQCEDQVIPFRAYLNNNAPRYLDKKLIKYRRFNKIIKRRDHFLKILNRNCTSYRQYMTDARVVGYNGDEINEINWRCNRDGLKINAWRLQNIKSIVRMIYGNIGHDGFFSCLKYAALILLSRYE